MTAAQADYGGRLDEAAVRALRRRLLAWFRRTQRDLPWRRTRDPYRIWVSEVMLQQTQVTTVVPYYARFLEAFPTVAALAEAADEALLGVWQGLGYYRRAMHLRRAAQAIVRDHAGHVPDDPEAFAALPGVGRYTCGAVQSIAFGHRLAAVDGNAVRVLARWLAVEEAVDGGAVQAGLWAAAARLLSPRAPGRWNEAVMELGARVCLPRGPQCLVCPVSAVCLARARGQQDALPRRKPRRKVPHVEVGAALVWRGGKVLLCKRPAEAMLGGLWEFPGGKREPGESIAACIRRELREECGLEVAVGEHLVDVEHAYSHFRVTLRCYHCRAPKGRVRDLGCTAHAWVRPEAIGTYPLPAADVKILEALGVGGDQGPLPVRRRGGGRGDTPGAGGSRPGYRGTGGARRGST